jgi:type IV pilus assembly protein PilM
MAVGGCVWGIDVGQTGLKALRARLSGDRTSIVADSFDYIEYPKILSQPDADPDQLVREALKQFLSRNSIRGDKIAISVSGQSGLARFIELPPVDPKQLPKLVGFEAKQQIPFALDDVVWDYQQMPGCGELDEEGDLPPENVVGLFAMKRDQVMRIIRPLVNAEIELDIVQLTPVCIYNAVTFDLYPEDIGEIDPSRWTVVLSMGTDVSDLVLTNGLRVWQRSIPLGGNHFTKQLTKEMKLTLAKAEHLKRNAREAKDAREIFRAMRPTFNDLVTEIQRSVGYFSSLDRSADIRGVVALGNAVKLPGLTQYLEKNLKLPVSRMDQFQRLTGPGVTEAPVFKENAMAFTVTYGLVVQALGLGKLSTNLIPREILTQRLVRRKKPWAAAAAACVLLALAFNFFFNWRAWYAVNDDRQTNNISWSSVGGKVQSLDQESLRYQNVDQEQTATLARLSEIGEAAVGTTDGRLLWLELIKAVTDALPVDAEGNEIPTLQEKPLKERKQIYIERVESQYFADLTQWFDDSVRQKYEDLQKIRRAEQEAAAAAATEGAQDVEGAPPAAPPPAESETPSIAGPGWVIEIQGFHFQHNDRPGEGADYVRKFLLDQLEKGTVQLPSGPDGDLIKFQVRELGILCPVEIQGGLDPNFQVVNPDYQPPVLTSAGFDEPRGDRPIPLPDRRTRPDANRPAETINETAYRFTVQFCWTQRRLRERLDQRRQQPQPELASAAPGEE